MINFSRTKLLSYLRKSLKVGHFHYSSAFTMEKLCNDAKGMFQAAVSSVQPETLINQSVEVDSNFVQIQGQKFDLRRNIYIVGFGKAVLGMADALENKLKEHLVSGIVSIPDGSKSSSNQQRYSSIQVYKGAYNNIPDEKSYLAARKISELVASLTETDLLFILISGGGSALLPSPKEPITLEEKIKVIKLLASKGASINELNTVRKRLSELKGGGLAKLAKPAKVVSLILSDIIGDPLDLIASGPTVKNTDPPTLPLNIIEKYKLINEIPKAVLNLLENVKEESDDDIHFSHVSNFIIGSNRVALEAAALASKSLDYHPIIVTDAFSGMARLVSRKLIHMTALMLEGKIESAIEIYKTLNLPEKTLPIFLSSYTKLKSERRKLCILLGGETTVEVCGTGIGGRNQELALAASIELSIKKLKNDIVLLSSGTDGIDGPTDAAGALATKHVIELAEKENLNFNCLLNNNDSYTFYSKLCNGKFHIKTGHTGTNVMDIIIILINC
ncbi:glycerate kinase isoform X1 [Parasteatoda tepidariorum]|uniref:glycerate kinase isoform X1 n=2 Tax=Parasteatoda tepidariorum TaxID=114398 RepID=UPI001C71B568|nr:glycerate kinase isoform X1 [Parasteatoda tepidariorum]